MASKSDIQAGGAFIRLFVKDAEFKKGLASAQSGMRSFATGIAGIGVGLAAAGGAVLAGITKSLSHFADIGGELNDMSLRTGVAGSKLAFFRYAAEQTGASIEDIEAAIRHASKHGFSAENFEQMALEIARIEDPTKRAARAMELFGKGGTRLLPMFGELNELRARWEKLGISPSDASIRQADELGDLWGDLKATFASIAYEIGAAVAPAAKELANVLVPIVASLNQWIKNNPQLVTGIAGIAAAMFVVGVAITTVAAALAPIVALIAGLFTWGGLVVVILASTVAQLALFAAGLAALIYAFVRFTNIGRLMFATMTAGFGRLAKSAIGTFETILNFLLSGKLEKAWEAVITSWNIALLDFSAAAFHKFAMLAEIMEAISTSGASLAFGSPLADMIRDAGESDQELADTLRQRMSELRRESQAGGDRDNPESPGYGLPTRNAAIVGTNARAAIMSRQVIGGGRNAVQDLLSKILNLQGKEEKHLGVIARNSRRPRVR